jgi:succinoglycan biosynthesis protein ExoM
MQVALPHISVCICTYKRAAYLDRLLRSLENQVTDNLFTYSVVVVDNDSAGSAQTIVDAVKRSSRLTVEYFVEPEQNISLARNKAVENASGDFIAFIDDDEWPPAGWLVNLFKTLRECDASGVLGPVIPHFDCQPPRWVLEGRFYHRPLHDTGTVLRWNFTRTGNVLLKKGLFEMANFRPEFGRGGEDRDLFRRLIERGHRFVWCAEAAVYESVPPERCTRSFMLRRALLRGQIPNFGALELLKSLVAVPVYSICLPFLLLLGQHTFMKYLIKDFDHIGRILAFCGIDGIKQKYVMR